MLRRTIVPAIVEFLLTTVLLFLVVTIVRWVAGTSPVSRAVPGVAVQQIIIGVFVGLAVGVLMSSPPRRLGTGFMNPAISVAMWGFHKVPATALWTFVVAELAGSTAGTFLGRAVWGPPAVQRPVDSAMIRTAPWLGHTTFFLIEASTMAVIIVLAQSVGLRDQRLVPVVVGALVALAIAGLGEVTGGSDNPARIFGPCLAAGEIGNAWIFLIAPMAGSALVVGVVRFAERVRAVSRER